MDSDDDEVVQQADIDFLNLSHDKPPPTIAEPVTRPREPSVDLLGGFDASFSNPIPDLLNMRPTVSQQEPGGLDDIFGSIGAPSGAIPQNKSSSDLNGLNLNFDAFGGTTTHPINNFPAATASNNFDPFGSILKTSDRPSNPPQQSEPNVSKDPFADIGNLGSNLNPNWSQGFGASKTTPSPRSTQYSTPIHQFAGQQQQPAASSAPSTATASPRGPSTPIHQMRSPSEQQRPDYSRSHFQEQQANNNANQKPKSADIFGDILGSQGYSFGSKGNQGPRSINDMRKTELARDMDPERLKIMEWVNIE